MSTPAALSAPRIARLTSERTLPVPFSGSAIQKTMVSSRPSGAKLYKCTAGATSVSTRGTAATAADSTGISAAMSLP